MTLRTGSHLHLGAALTLVATLWSVADAAHANANASAYISDERAPLASTPAPSVGPVSATQTGGTPESEHFASASADLATGVLRATAQSQQVGPYLLPANAATSFTDTITFSGGYGGIAYLDWSFDGSISVSNSPYNGQFGAAFGQFSVYESTALGASRQDVTLAPQSFACGAGCIFGTSIARTGSLAIPINLYGAFIQVNLSTFSTYGNLAEFGHTSKLYLRTPEGVTYTSASGQLFASAEPILNATALVPEPQTWAMLGVGLAFLTSLARHRGDARTGAAST